MCSVLSASGIVRQSVAGVGIVKMCVQVLLLCLVATEPRLKFQLQIFTVLL